MKNCTTRQTRLDNWLQVSERERGGGRREERGTCILVIKEITF